MGIIGCGVFDKNYIYFIVGFTLTMIFLVISLFIAGNNNDNEDKEQHNNILLTVLLSNFGKMFFVIPEIILKKNLLDKKEDKKESLLTINKTKTKTAIQYIFNEFSDKLSIKDKILIFISSILILISEYIKGLIQIRNTKQTDQLVVNEQYNFILLFFVVTFSYLFFKIKFYKHQMFSIMIIIVLGFLRYILKLKYYYTISDIFNYFIDISLEVISAIIESMSLIYIKGLMEYKFYSPFKICYIYGIINTIILFILLITFSFIKTENSNWLFCLKYNNSYYLDNIYSIKENYGYYLFVLFFSSIFYGILKLLICVTISKYTVCHILILLQNGELVTNLFYNNSYFMNNEKIIFYPLLVISYFIELFFVLVFLEIIELKFCSLNENVKRNIKERAENEVRSSLENLQNKIENIEEGNETNDSMTNDEN